MKYLVFLMLLVFAGSGFGQDDDIRHKTDWDAFSKNLAAGIQCNNQGVRLASLQLIIRYADSLDMDCAKYDIVRMLRLSKDDRVRRLAMVTLHKMKCELGMRYLKSNLPFETNPSILAQSRFILHDYYNGRENKEVGTDTPLMADKK